VFDELDGKLGMIRSTFASERRKRHKPRDGPKFKRIVASSSRVDAETIPHYTSRGWPETVEGRIHRFWFKVGLESSCPKSA